MLMSLFGLLLEHLLEFVLRSLGLALSCPVVLSGLTIVNFLQRNLMSELVFCKVAVSNRSDRTVQMIFLGNKIL